MDNPTLHFIVTYAGLIGLISMSLCLLIYGYSRRQTDRGGREGDLDAKQAAHTRPTPRIAGIAIFASIFFGIVFAPSYAVWPYLKFMLAASIVFGVGLLEDLGRHVSPFWRLMAAVASSLAVVLLFGEWIPHADVPGLDGLMGYWYVGVPLTLLVTAGVANGFNLIDGVNGFAAFAGVVAAISLSLISYQTDYHLVFHLGWMLAAAILGFAVINYPFGLIFLGDAGAYTLGFVISWLGIAVLNHNPLVSPWAILLVVFWPVADMLLALWRRRRRKVAAMHPDRLHMHQLIMRGLEICWLGPERRLMANSLTTVILAPFMIAPAATGILFWDHSRIAVLFILLYGVLFFGFYQFVFRFVVRHRRKTVA